MFRSQETVRIDQMLSSSESSAMRAETEFDPETGTFGIEFSVPRCQGLPPGFYELLSLASGATSIRIDLRALEIADPLWAREELVAALSGQRCKLVVLWANRHAATELRGSYFLG